MTLDDVASMAAVDENHRYELSPEGVLSVMPPADPEHALLVMRMILWLASHGYEAEQIAAGCGIDVGGGRVPDLTVWAKGMPPRRARSNYAGTSGLLLAVEVVSSGSEIVDRITKKAENAKAGIPRYWIVERDGGATVNRHVLNEAAEYEPDPAGPQPLAWLLASAPDIEQLHRRGSVGTRAAAGHRIDTGGRRPPQVAPDRTADHGRCPASGQSP